jgi:hypothetical protein
MQIKLSNVCKNLLEKVAVTSCFVSVVMAGQSYWLTGVYAAVGAGEQTPALIPWSKYTHVSHFSVSPTANCTINTTLVESQIAAFVTAAHMNGRKALITIVDGAPGDFLRCTDADHISEFNNNLVNVVNSNAYDGVDLDWEQVPNSFNNYITQYNDLIGRLRTALLDKVITLAVYWRSPGRAMERVAAMSQSNLDRVNIMCYDMDVNKGYSWYVSALWQGGSGNRDACDAQVDSFTSAGFPKSKINVGFPFYGRINSNVTGPGLSQLLPRGVTVYYRNLVMDQSRWQNSYKNYDAKHGANYLSIPHLNEFVSYGGVEMVDELVTWVKSQEFGGITTFTTGYEYLSDQAGDARYPLTNRIYRSLFNAEAPGTGRRPVPLPSPRRRMR